MKCPYCGQRNSDRARVCSRCGKRLDKVREKRKEKRILAAGIVLVLVILCAGAGAIYMLSRMMKPDAEHRFLRSLYLSHECSIAAKYVKGRRIL